jgi:polyphosphate kinase 2 (PPK2 family)
MPAWAAFVGHTFPLETPVELSSQWIGNREELREIAVGQQSWANPKDGIFLRKYFLDISKHEQRRRFEARIEDPLKHWKLSPMGH